MIAAVIALPIGLSCCDKKPDPPRVEAPNVAATADAMSGMAMPAGSTMGRLQHSDSRRCLKEQDYARSWMIPAVGWPAMKMSFSAEPDLLKGVAVGDKIDFDVTVPSDDKCSGPALWKICGSMKECSA